MNPWRHTPQTLTIAEVEAVLDALNAWAPQSAEEKRTQKRLIRKLAVNRVWDAEKRIRIVAV